MIIGIPKETFPNERRVALVPAAVPSLTEAGLDVVVEAGAGQSAGFPDVVGKLVQTKILSLFESATNSLLSGVITNCAGKSN